MPRRTYGPKRPRPRSHDGDGTYLQRIAELVAREAAWRKGIRYERKPRD